LEILYKNNATKEVCEDLKKATKYFGGNKILAVSLLSRVNALSKAEVLNDIIVQTQMRFHKLFNLGKKKNYEGYFAIDVKTKRDKWRIILQPLDDNKMPFVPCKIDEISKNVKIVEIKEVSNHYE